MSKFSKKSLAVLTTAAIMASSMSIVAFAATAASVKVEAGIKSVAAADGTQITDGNTSIDADTYTITLEDGYENPTVTSDGTTITVTDGSFALTKDDINGCAIVISATKKATGGTSEPTPAGEENFDSVVWVNGKDTKASKDGKTPASLYKTEQFDQVMMSAGGKWQVAVTDTTIDSPEAFVKKFDEKGKFDATMAKAMKTKASAKIKEGTVTVTAGKEAGVVNVWVYEVKNKTVVACVEGNKYEELGVDPEYREFTVKMAPSLTYTAAKEDGTGTTVDAETNTIKAVEKPEKLAKGYDAGKDVIVYLCDKKNDISLDATYVLWDGKGKAAAKLNEDGQFVGEGYTAELVAATATAGPAVKITIADTATEKTKIDVQVKNVESGKVAKIAPKVNKPAAADKTEEFTLTVGDGVKVLVDGTEQTLTDGKVKLAKGTKVTFDVDVTIGDKDVTAGTAYEVTADATVAAKAA